MPAGIKTSLLQKKMKTDFDQMSIFDYTMPMIHITKTIRLIELFAGYGSQAMALERMGVNFEHYKVVEFDKYAIASYNAVHGTKFPTMDITKVYAAELNICETNKYEYIMTYSFPCTDLSVAGKMKGMKKGSGTRSGLLWEVERILTEINENGGELPQILFMENVPQVISDANIKDFHAWQDFLSFLGYTNHLQVLNAKDYGVAQNRERTFMFSFLGEYNYKFPEPIPLKKTMKDYLKDYVDEKYYINTDKAKKLIETLIADNRVATKSEIGLSVIGSLSPEKECQDRVRGFSSDGISPSLRATDYKDPTKICIDLSIHPKKKIVSNCITAREDREISNQQSVGNGVIQLGNIAEESTFENPQTGRIYDSRGCAPTLNTCSGGGHEPKTIVAMRGRNQKNPSDRTVGAPTEQRLEPNSLGICNALTSVQKDNMVLEKAEYIWGGMQEHQTPRTDCICPSITAACGMGGGQTPILTEKNESLYRIRKLTPRECGRLMDVSDEDITKMEKVNSNSQLYKQFGNSIVVGVMVAMFQNLNIDQR